MDVDPRTEEQSRLLAESENLAVLSVVDEADGDCTVRDLAEGLLDREVAVVETEEYQRRLEETVVTLHHQKLPRLADAGLLEYDPETHRVAVQSGTVQWRQPAVPEGVAEYLETVGGGENQAGSAADGEGLGTVQGRDAVVQYGRELVDEADSEVFGIYVSTELLRDECIERVRRAIERDVSVHIGSQNQTVRRLVRERLSGVTVWEPQTDWLNTSSFPRLGRLVFTDRSKVMLAVLDESATDDGDPQETAIVGEGVTHPLVVLVRDLLGPRLDHLDYQSDEFTSQLPS